MIDKEDTRKFPRYCRLLMKGGSLAKQSIEKHAKDSRETGEELLTDAADLLQLIRKRVESYDQKDLIALRTSKNLTHAFCRRITADVARDTLEGLVQYQGVNVHPRPEQIKTSLIFRFYVCYCALAIRRAGTGGLQKQTPKNFRNDINDCFYASYATLFDGLLSCDPGLVETYNIALTLLDGVFDCRHLTASHATQLTPFSSPPGAKVVLP